MMYAETSFHYHPQAVMSTTGLVEVHWLAGMLHNR